MAVGEREIVQIGSGFTCFHWWKWSKPPLLAHQFEGIMRTWRTATACPNTN